MNEHFFIYNKEYYPAGTPVVSPGNNGLRYGDGLFETMRMCEGKIINIVFHFERLFSGMEILQLNIPGFFSKSFFERTVNELLLKNSISKNARIRLMVFRGDGSIFNSENNSFNYIIEVWPLNEKIQLNEKGLAVDVFAGAKKSYDQFSNLKSNNYLPSVMAGIFAQKNNLDDAIILNAFGRVCESAIANIFIIKGDKIYTPPLSEGCVAGTMRRWMLEKFSLKNYIVMEKNLSVDDLLDADEFFLTNAIHPIRWVKKLRDKNYENRIIKEIHQSLIQNI